MPHWQHFTADINPSCNVSIQFVHKMLINLVDSGDGFESPLAYIYAPLFASSMTKITTSIAVDRLWNLEYIIINFSRA